MKITSDIYDVDARFARILNKRSLALRASLLEIGFCQKRDLLQLNFVKNVFRNCKYERLKSVENSNWWSDESLDKTLGPSGLAFFNKALGASY